MSVPRRIIQAWCGPTPIPEREREWCAQMKEMNPDFEYHFFGNDALDRYRSDTYIHYMVERGEKWAFIVDRLRLLLLRDYGGGIWIDPDAKPLRPLRTLPWWDAPHVDFVTAHRSPYRKGVALDRGISLVDNTVMACAKDSRILGRLLSLYHSKAPIRRGGEFGREIIDQSGMDVVWEDPAVFYAMYEHPKAVILHDPHNIASWVDHPPLQFADR